MLPWLEAVAAPEVKEETLSEEEEEEQEEEEGEEPEHLAPVQDAPAQEAPAQETPVEEHPFKLTRQHLEQHENTMEALKKAYDAFEVEVLEEVWPRRPQRRKTGRSGQSQILAPGLLPMI